MIFMMELSIEELNKIKSPLGSLELDHQQY
jgi:hypothetical protein